LIPGTRWLVHAAAALPLYSRQDILSTEVEGTRNLLEAALRNDVERFIYISSTAVYGIPERVPVSETDALVGVGPYGRAKIEAERLCVEYRRRGLCVPVIRPKSFVGQERLGVFELLYSWAKEGRSFPIPGKGNNRYQLLDVEDLCAAIYLCAIREKHLVNTTFNIGAKEFATLREDFQAVLDAAGCGKGVVPVPRRITVSTLRLLAFFHLSPIYRWIYETAGRDSIVSIEKAERALGYSPRYSNQMSLLRNYQWYCHSYRPADGSPGVSHRTVWRHGVLRIVKAFF
jgi:nucleoside-diphosphate-sugar epimerase